MIARGKKSDTLNKMPSISFDCNCNKWKSQYTAPKTRPPYEWETFVKCFISKL